MIRLLHNVKIDWLAQRRYWLIFSSLLMLAGLGSAVTRQLVPGGTDAFNLGVDFKAGTVMTVRFNQRPSDDAIRTALEQKGVQNAIVQSTEKPNEVLVKVPQQGSGEQAQEQAQVNAGQAGALSALTELGPEVGAKVERTDAVGPAAGRALRNQAIAVTLLALVGVLLYIGSRFEWTYGAAAVITVFHDVLVTLGIFSIMQWEIDLTVIAALLTLVGFSVNDTIVTFDRIRENLRLHRRTSLYDLTNEAINQTLAHGHHGRTSLLLRARHGDLRRRCIARFFAGALYRHHRRHVLDHRHRDAHHGVVPAASRTGKARDGRPGRRHGRLRGHGCGRAQREGQVGRARVATHGALVSCAAAR
jgi:preprotein translocase subunit SecF